MFHYLVLLIQLPQVQQHLHVQKVYYINGFFVQVDASTLILDKYTNTPSYRIGFTLTESFVTPSDDSSLNDNAAVHQT